MGSRRRCSRRPRRIRRHEQAVREDQGGGRRAHPAHDLLPVTLSLIALIRVLMLRGTGIPASSMVQIAVAALILGKAVVIADLLPFINRYPERPLAYNIAWKTAIYTLVAMLIHYIERLIDFWRQAGGFIAG